MSGRVIVLGDLEKRYETEWNIAQRFPEVHVETVARPWELVERAVEGEFDIAVILKGSISEHGKRIETIASLRRNGFSGRIIATGAFLSEKQDALAAGADYAFDSHDQAVENVMAAALFRPRLAVDHPYLRYLFLKQWAVVDSYADVLPAKAPELLLVALSLHPGEVFYASLVEYRNANPGVACILVEDTEDEDIRAEALATGIDPYVAVEEAGLTAVLELGGRLLRESWLARVSTA